MLRLNATWGDSQDDGVEDQGPPIWDQGNCGSCWAISAVEAVEAQLMKQNGASTRLSAQALVDCVPNPHKCGGTGGCDGATGELAYEYMRDHGIPVDADLPYSGRTTSCGPSFLQGTSGMRARVGGWNNLPSNQAAPVKQALVETGPVVVAVDGSDWFNYDSGVFDGCQKDAVLSHAVLLKGYGQDAGKKYWTIQNSWGSDWGEHGNIRLLRHDDDRAYCGQDNKPQDGVGCEGGPPSVEVCGMCGMLYDPVVPTGIYLEQGSGRAEQAGSDSAAASFAKADLLADNMLSSATAAEAQDTATLAVDPVTKAQPTATQGHTIAEAELEAVMGTLKI
jgi:cathepsin L